MYDTMAEAIETNAKDCEAMGIAVEAAVDAHASAVNSLNATRANMKPSEVGSSNKRLRQAEGERMESVRKSLRKGMSECKTNQQLLGALRKLAKMNEVSE